MLGKILKTVVKTALLPIEVVKDVATLGTRAAMENDGKTYTGKKFEEIVEDLDEIA